MIFAHGIPHEQRLGVEPTPCKSCGREPRDRLRRYDAVTPESALKFAELHPDRGRYDFAFGDRLVDWSAANGKPMHVHGFLGRFERIFRRKEFPKKRAAPVRTAVTTIPTHSAISNGC